LTQIQSIITTAYTRSSGRDCHSANSPGDLDRAEILADSLPNSEQQARLLVSMAEAVARANDADRAGALILRAQALAHSIQPAWSSIRDDFEQARPVRTLTLVANAVATVGDVDRAGDFIESEGPEGGVFREYPVQLAGFGLVAGGINGDRRWPFGPVEFGVHQMLCQPGDFACLMHLEHAVHAGPAVCPIVFELVGVVVHRYHFLDGLSGSFTARCCSPSLPSAVRL
jgi:hypothetical protein